MGFELIKLRASPAEKQVTIAPTGLRSWRIALSRPTFNEFGAPDYVAVFLGTGSDAGLLLMQPATVGRKLYENSGPNGARHCTVGIVFLPPLTIDKTTPVPFSFDVANNLLINLRDFLA